MDTLQSLGGSISKKGAVCKQVGETLANPDDLESLYYAVQVASSLGCLKGPGGSAIELITNAVEQSNVPSSLFFAINSGLVLKENKLFSKLDTGSFEGVVETLVERFDEELSPREAGFAFSTAALIARSVKLGEDASTSLGIIGELVFDVLSESEEQDDGSVCFREGDLSSTLETTAIVLRGIVELDEVHSLDLPSVRGLAAMFFC